MTCGDNADPLGLFLMQIPNGWRRVATSGSRRYAKHGPLPAFSRSAFPAGNRDERFTCRGEGRKENNQRI